MQIERGRLFWILQHNGEYIKIDDKIWETINSHKLVRSEQGISIVYICNNCGIAISTGIELMMIKENGNPINYHPKTCSEMRMKLACE